MYHNQHTMDQGLYQKELAKNAQLQAEVTRLKSEGTAVNKDYVDKEFKDKEDLMYSDDFVKAAYNPEVTQPPKSNIGRNILIVLVCLVLGGVLIYLVFFRNWKA